MQANEPPAIYSARTFCPECQEKINLHLVTFRPFSCPHCHEQLDVSKTYNCVTAILAFIGSLALAYIVGLKAYLALGWIVLLFLSFAFVPSIVKSIIPPRLEPARPVEDRTEPTEPWKRKLTMFLAFWFGGTIFLFAYGYILGWSAVVVGGARSMGRDVAEVFSGPLAWINSSFVIQPDSNFVTVLGIVFANTFFYAAILTVLVSFVRSRMKKSEVLQMGISEKVTRDDDD